MKNTMDKMQLVLDWKQAVEDGKMAQWYEDNPEGAVIIKDLIEQVRK